MYVFWGKVKSGEKRGKTLGFPTANISLRKKIPEGIYISKAIIERKWYPALTFIGKAKTFDGKEFQAETYFLSYNKNVYGKWISIRLIKKIRGNKKFNSEKELIIAMQKDEEKAKNYFNAL